MNTFWAAVTAILTAGGVLVAWLAYRRRRPEPRGVLEYEVERTSSVLRTGGRIKVLVDDEPNAWIDVVDFRFTNAGRGPIKAEDFSEPLTLYSSSRTKIYRAEAFGPAVDGRANAMQIEDDERIVIPPLLINPEEHFSVRLIADLGDWKVRARIANTEVREKKRYTLPAVEPPSFAAIVFSALTTVFSITIMAHGTVGAEIPDVVVYLAAASWVGATSFSLSYAFDWISAKRKRG